MKELINFIKDYKFNKYNFPVKNGEYSRNIICANDKYEVIIITWSPNCKSKIHDHAANGCIFKVLEGELIEYKYTKKLELIKTNKLKVNDTNYIDNNIGYHPIENGNKKSVSVHIYSPPYATTLTY